MPASPNPNAAPRQPGPLGSLGPAATAAALPYPQLALSLAAVLANAAVRVPPRLVQPLPGGGSLFVMPAHDERIAITKLITFVAGNAARGLPTIQGDIVVFDVATGQRLCLIDGPTVTARRTAAASLLAAQRLASTAARQGPLLIVGAGVQGRSHLEAFRAGLGVQEVWVASRSAQSAEALAAHARTLGMTAHTTTDPDAALPHCPLVVSATPAQQVVLRADPRPDAFVAAVGAFTPSMVEWDAPVVQRLAQRGRVVVDTRDADHEAGDLILAGLDVARFPALASIPARPATPGAEPPPEIRAEAGPVFFKSCGWAGWDLAAARLVVEPALAPAAAV
jgi:1-piperideine-2-carboxylate/1-pyrroline-2-carboxylate reductase [NAD(P)H]